MQSLSSSESVFRSISARPALLAAIYAACAVAVVWPLFLVEVPALADYPNHLARMHVLGTYDISPALQRNYVVDWAVVPNLAMDAVVPLIAPIFGLHTSGKLFIALTLILPVAGVMAVRRVVHGRVGLWSLAAVLFVYNYPWTWGFLNYLFGVGLCLLFFAAWIASAEMSRPKRLALFTVATVVLYFSHFFALAIYGLLVLGHEIWRIRTATAPAREARAIDPRTDFLWSMGQFLAPAALLLTTPAWDGTKVTAYGTLTQKFVAALSPLLSYATFQDVLAMVVVVALALWMIASRRLVVAPALRWSLGLLLVAAVLMPYSLLSNWLTDIRLPPVLALFLIAATSWSPPGRRWVTAVVGVCFLVWAGRTAEIANVWKAFDEQYAEFAQVSHAIPKGARVLAVQSVPPDDSPLVARRNYLIGYHHMITLAVIERDIFTPTLFSNRAAQPVQAAPEVRDIDVPFGKPITPEMLAAGIDPARLSELGEMAKSMNIHAFWKDWPENFEYVVFVNWGEYANPSPRHLTPVARGTFFEIFKVGRASESGS